MPYSERMSCTLYLLDRSNSSRQVQLWKSSPSCGSTSFIRLRCSPPNMPCTFHSFAQLHQRLRLFVPLFLQHCAGQEHRCFLDLTVFPLRLGNVLVDDGQLLFQCRDDHVLTTIVFGRRREVFRGLLRVGVGVLFALDIAPGHGLRVGGGGVGFGLPGLGHVLFRLLLDLRQASAEAVEFFVEL